MSKYACVAVTRRRKVGRLVVLIGWYGPIAGSGAVERVQSELLKNRLDQGMFYKVVDVDEIDPERSILLPGEHVAFPTAYKPGTVPGFIEEMVQQYNEHIVQIGGDNLIISD